MVGIVSRIIGILGILGIVKIQSLEFFCRADGVFIKKRKFGEANLRICQIREANYQEFLGICEFVK